MEAQDRTEEVMKEEKTMKSEPTAAVDFKSEVPSSLRGKAQLDLTFALAPAILVEDTSTTFAESFRDGGKEDEMEEVKTADEYLDNKDAPNASQVDPAHDVNANLDATFAYPSPLLSKYMTAE